MWLEAEPDARAAIDARSATPPRRREPGLAARAGRRLRRRRPRLHGLEHPIRDQEAFLPPGKADVPFLCNRGANGIDRPDLLGHRRRPRLRSPTTIVTGDLGLLHDIGGLAALRDVSTPVRIVVVNNDGGGIFDFLPQPEALHEESSKSS